MHDLLITNGTLVDGTGEPAREGGVAIKDGKIVEVGKVAGQLAKRTIDAEGHLITPGFVDIHTHYDAQVSWDPMLTPSSWHGVTTVVMGNCGVGFAPVRPDKHQYLIDMMEGVEDIPGAALSEGITWGWETFSEYMDVLEKMDRAVDIGVQVPHCPVRVYVMGERGAKNEDATADDIEKMSKIVEEGVRAGALGFSTSRTMIHRSKDGELVPGTFAGEAELFGLGRALQRAGHGVFQMTSNHHDMPKEMPWMRALALETGRPVLFNLLQIDQAPELWRQVLAMAEAGQAEGANLLPSVAGRPNGVLMCWKGTAHPFVATPTFLSLRDLPHEEMIAKLKDPAIRQRIMTDEHIDLGYGDFQTFLTTGFHKMFPLGEKPNYEPDSSESVLAIAKRENKKPADVAYDLMLENDGHALLYFPVFGYSNNSMEGVGEMLQHPLTRISLGDGGAHCSVICDASIPTFLLTHWVRDRAKERKLSLEWAIKKQTSDTASVYGFTDRGLLKPGMKADVNVIDFDNLTLHSPEMVADLPAGGRRLIQRATGYRATIVDGAPIFENGEATGSMPGKLVRGGRDTK